MVYEVSWYRMLSLFLGATVLAAALVLSLYMLGMGLGAWYAGRYGDRFNRYSYLLGGLHFSQALTGGWGLAILSLLPRIYHLTGTGLLGSTVTYLSVILAIMPGALAAGAMVPAFAKAFITQKEGLGWGIGRLYSLEAMGSVAGSLAIAFFMIPLLGQRASVLMAMAANAVMGLLLISYINNSTSSPAVGSIPRSGKKKWERGSRWPLLLVASVLGFSGLGLQVIWNRAMSVYLPNNTYTFSLIAAIYLSGISAGNLFYGSVQSRMRNYQRWLWPGLMATAIVVGAGFLLLDKMPRLVLFPLTGLLASETVRLFLPPVLLALALCLLPTFCLGLCSPLVCRLYAERMESLSTDIGRLRAVNTLGSALGPLAVGLLMIPLWGVGRSLLVMVGFLATISLIAIKPGAEGKRRRLVSLSLAAVILAAMFLSKPVTILPPSMHQRTAEARIRSDSLLYYKETAEGTIIVTQDRNTGLRACYVNNSAVVGTSYDAIKVVKLLGHLPFFCGAGYGPALVVGFGIGVTASTVASHPEVERVDCVEIAPGLREAASFFHDFNRGVLTHPKIRIIAGDGRAYLQKSRERYQVISADPTHPTLGCAQLYTREYFQLCRQHLDEDGIICQYLPFHGLTSEEFLGILATFKEVFPHAALWLGQSHGVLMGWMKPPRIDFTDFKNRVRAVDDPLFYKDPYAVAACLLLDEEDLEELAGEGKINCDDKNYIEYFSPLAKSPYNWERNISRVLAAAGQGGIFFGMDDSIKFNKYLKGRGLWLQAMISQNRRDRRAMLALMMEAVKEAPENEEWRFLLEREIKNY